VAGNSAVQQDPHQATARIVSEAATGAVLVKGIPPEATNADIRHHFSCCGHATRVSLLKMPRTGERSELAWVEFSTAVAAQKALDMSGSTFMSREVEVFQKDSQAARSEVEKLNRPAPNPQYAEYGRGRGRGRGPPRSFKWVRTES